MFAWRLGVPALATLVACTAETPSDIQPTCAVDDFSATAIDETTWGIYEQPPTTIEQRDGVLRADFGDGVAAYASVFSIQEIDYRGTSAAVEVTEVPDVEGVEVLLQWVVNNNYRHFIAAEAGRLYFGTQNDADYTSAETPFDPVAHRHWRLRNERNTIVYETSADGASWTVGHTSGVLIPLDEAYVELAAGAYLEVAGAHTAAFDNFQLAGACAP